MSQSWPPLLNDGLMPLAGGNNSIVPAGEKPLLPTDEWGNFTGCFNQGFVMFSLR